ncbi:MAG: SDR family NAD(P)-dependent oxidoreductase [Flavobacteriales bacterium]|nr:SDR family NAD(P)-dependent oxidoreductase [Flavobacteriales bacterium]
MKRAIITGASGGIGLAIAQQLANKGYNLTLVARNQEKLQAIVQTLEGKEHQFITADLSDNGGIEQVAKHIRTTPYDVLINNAGAGVYGAFTELNLEAQMNLIKLNMDALVILSYSFLKKARSGDALINVGSVLGSTSYSGASTYAGTKGFVVRFSESLWNEYRKKGIYVCVFSPGLTSTHFHKAAGGDSSDFPAAIQQTADEVAKECISALNHRSKPHVVSGFMNRTMLLFYRLLPRKMIVKIMGSF